MRSETKFALFAVALLAAQALSAAPETRPFTDSAGRVIQVPVEVRKAFSVGQPGTVLLYTLCREKLIAWNIAPSPIQHRFLSPESLKLPALGGWGGSNPQADLEQLVARHPDVLISVGEISPFWIDNANRVQEQTGIPVALLRCDLPEIAAFYREAGKLLGVEERAEKLAAYCRNTLDAVAKAVADIPEAQRVRVYYAEGPRGLQTDPPGSFHTQILEMVRAVNVAQGIISNGEGRRNVSLEQIVGWAPQCILLDTETEAVAADPIGKLFSDPVWQVVPAIQRRAVHVIPRQPYNWFGRPPSVNRLLGLQWVAHTLYPDAYPIDLIAVIQEYYRLFYEIELSVEDARRLESGVILE